MSLFCDVSLPVPLDQPFTYALPETLRHRVREGSRLIVPFGPRKLTGVILRCHDEAPPMDTREALRLIDAEPVLDGELLALGRWIAAYYCAPLGEVLRGMLPLSAEVRHGKVWSLTDSGRDAARQLLFDTAPDDPVSQILHMLEKRPLSAAYIAKTLPLAEKALRSLERRGFVVAEQVEESRDPLRAPAARLRVELAAAPPEQARLSKPERELRAFLELHPGSHNLKELEEMIRNASPAARSLARRGIVSLTTETVPQAAGPVRTRHALNPAQQAAFGTIREAILARRFHTFLLHGVTGSGKTEVYLNAIETAVQDGRSALLLVPEIALTPAMAGQFFSRFGDRVAILHSAFTDAERSEQWRRIRSGAASVVVGTRSGVFAPVRNLGLIVVDEEHDGSYKQEETPRYNGRDVAIVRAQGAGACVVLGFGHAQPGEPVQRRTRQVHAARIARAYRGPAHAGSGPHRHAPGVSGNPQTERLLAEAAGGHRETSGQWRTDHRAAEPARLLELRGLPGMRRARRLHELFPHPDLSQARPAAAVPLLRVRRKGPARRVPSAPATTCTSWGWDRSAWRRNCTSITRRRGSPAWTATRSPERGSTRPSCSEFREGNYDLLVGTQMIAKGHDIPNVTLVGVVSADIGLGMPDFRAAERTFQLLTQVAGRAGRGNVPGIVLVQTINPDHYAVRLAAAQDYGAFYEKELNFRRMMLYPPFSAMANVLVRAEKQETAMRMSADLGLLLNPPPEKLRIMGPAEAPVPRLKNEYRYQFLIKASSRKALNELLQRIRMFALDRKWGATALVIDVDPLTLM